MKAFRTIAGVTAAGVIALGLLTACTPTTPTPTPTTSKSSTPTPSPTPTAVSAPASDTDAIAAGYARANDFFRVWDETQNDHPNDTSELEAIATGPALDGALKAIKSRVSQGITTTGTSKFTLLDGQSYAAPTLDANGAVELQFGQPVLIGCLDSSRIKVKKADGTESAPALPMLKVSVTARYFKAESRWMIVDYTNTLEGTECAG